MTSPTDLVVVLPGILGSTLSKNGRLVWAPSAGSALRAIATFGGSVKDLRLPYGIGDEDPHDGVVAVDLMPDLHVLPGIWTPVKGYDKLLARLRSLGYREPDADSPGNLIRFPYDWRLSCRLNGTRLAAVVENALDRWQAQRGPFAEATVVFVCHSMGGLIARWYVEKCGGAEVTRKLITLGTPYRGAARALEQLVNGADRKLGPFHLDLTGFARSIPSMYQLMPEYACLEGQGLEGQGLEGPGDLAKTTAVALPDLDSALVKDAMSFHTDLDRAEAARPQSLEATHAILGFNQPTATTARLANGRIELLDTYRGEDLFGDSTVPIVAASRPDVLMDSSTLRRVPDKHGNLQRNRAALDEVEGVLTARSIVVRGPGPVALRVDAPELALAGEDFTVRIAAAEPTARAVRLSVTDEQGTLVEARVLRSLRRPVEATIAGLKPGAYTVDVGGLDEGSPFAPVSSDMLVWAGSAF